MYTERHKDEYVSKIFFFERNSVNSIVKIALIYFFQLWEFRHCTLNSKNLISASFSLSPSSLSFISLLDKNHINVKDSRCAKIRPKCKL